MNFCDIIKELRDEKGVTQAVVAKNCGITATCVSQLESGARNPTGSTVRELAKYYGVTTDYLLGLEDDFGIKTTMQIGESFSTEEKNLIKDYRSLNFACKKLVKQTIETLKNSSGAAGAEKKDNVQ